MIRFGTFALTLALLLLPACVTSGAPVGHSTASPLPAAATAATSSPVARPTLLPAIRASLASLEPGMDAIAPERKERLGYVRSKAAAGEPARLIFICTHNSRRSQMGQLWAAAAAAYYNVDHVETYSGGLEVTAFNPRAVAAMQRAGFQIAAAEGDNPHRKVTFASDAPPLETFSKKFSDAFNPQQNFAAVMTCSHADASCPLVLGASLRIAIPYEDPKASDGTPEETATYDERSKQIATEMLFLFSRVKADARVSGL